MKCLANISVKLLRTTCLFYKVHFDLFSVKWNGGEKGFRETVCKSAIWNILISQSSVTTCCDFITGSFLEVLAPGVIWIKSFRLSWVKLNLSQRLQEYQIKHYLWVIIWIKWHSFAVQSHRRPSCWQFYWLIIISQQNYTFYHSISW